MKNFLLTGLFLLLIAPFGYAQLSVGSSGMTILSGTPVAIDGLILTPSASLSLANNSIQKTSTPIADNPSINRLYQFGTTLPFSGTVGVAYLTSELNGYTESSLQLAYAPAANANLIVTSNSTVNPSTHYVSNTVTNQNLFVVTATALSDLSPVLSAQPSSQYGTTSFGVVVSVYELNAVTTRGSFSVRINKDPKVMLSFPPTATSVAGQSVQNSAWSFDNTDEDFYIVNATQNVAAGDVLSFGLNGVLKPGGTSGTLSISSLVLPGTLVEANLTNNTDADKIEYFQQ